MDFFFTEIIGFSNKKIRKFSETDNQSESSIMEGCLKSKNISVFFSLLNDCFRIIYIFDSVFFSPIWETCIFDRDRSNDGFFQKKNFIISFNCEKNEFLFLECFFIGLILLINYQLNVDQLILSFLIRSSNLEINLSLFFFINPNLIS